MQQRLALFDLDGTLVDRQAAYNNVVTELCRAHGLGLPAEQWLLGQLAERANISDFAQFRDVFALSEPPETLWHEYVDRMAAAITCRPEVLEGLAELRAADWTIGIVSNGASDIQRAKLAATGI
ncbi:HAD hydrolase-like protein, partial [Streptomyces sp. NPDC006654]|uniref:HAD family hydrolase n=1 Tax=Streptomyces sp. NPDC006654 TaxID=3156897 RepID=UPI0033DE405E